MRLEDVMKDDDFYESIFCADEEYYRQQKKKKKKDKKKKKKLKAAMERDTFGRQSEERAIQDIYDMSKSELRNQIIKLNISSKGVDLESKKSMRNAILHATHPDLMLKLETGSEMRPTLPGAVKREITAFTDKNRPPHYLDEETGDFVIVNAVDAPDLAVYDAMCNLGAVRRAKRPTDGFGEMMDRLTKRLVQEANEQKAIGSGDDEIIDVEIEVVDETK